MKNEVRVKISGLNLSRLIEKLISRNVFIDNLVSKKNYIKFTINQKDLSILNDVCKKEHKFYTIIYRNNFKQVLSKLPYMLGGFVALIIIYAYMFAFNLFVFEVNVKCESNLQINIEKVNEVLEENGIKAGMFKSKFSSKEIEKLILLELDDVAGCSVKKQGGKLNIYIYPAVIKEESDEKDRVSNYNGIITHIDVFAGEANVKVGDIVKKGDILILNKNGASGVVKGNVYFVSTIIYNENRQFIEKTGKIFIARDYSIFNKNIIKDTNLCTFSTYLTKKCSFYISNNYILPIICNETIYYETLIRNEVIPFEEVQKEILDKAYNDALSKVPSGAKENNVSYSIVKDGPYTRVDCFIECEVSLF